MNRMQSIQDLIEEAKVRFLWWAICIFCINYFLSHTSKSMWMNVPLAVFLALLLRILTNEVEFRLKPPRNSEKSYLSSLEKKQLPVNDSCFSTPSSKWKRKFDSPLVEAAVEDFVDKIIQEFVTDLWYSDITRDKEAPEMMRVIILEALGEVAVRVKHVNLVDLLTRDLVDLIGDHIELFRRTQASIGVDVMVTLSSEERDERLKHHLMASNNLHPALISNDSEYKVLQRLVAGLLGVVLRPREAQSPLVRCIAREFVACLVVKPIVNLISPAYVNKLLELVLSHIKDFLVGLEGDDQLSKTDIDHLGFEGNTESYGSSSERLKIPLNTETDMPLVEKGERTEPAMVASEEAGSSSSCGNSIPPKPADWARVLDAATQRRTEVLAPENLENMWAIGRHYKEKINKVAARSTSQGSDNKKVVQILPGLNQTALIIDGNNQITTVNDINQVVAANSPIADGNKGRHRKSCSTSDLKVETKEKRGGADESTGLLISEDFFSPDFKGRSDQHTSNDARSLIQADGSHMPKLNCRVIGAYFEKLGSKSFAVYSIAVTDPHNNTWFVKRRYRNFERLHRHLKDIPNYNLQLPPKRIFSSSTEDSFVHQRCIQLDKYLQDLLSIANVAEQHEVWDFLSACSKNYSFGKSPSVMKTLAVNVDDAVDDIVRQFKGVSDGLVRKVVGSPSGHYEALPAVPAKNLSWNERDVKMHSSMGSSIETTNVGSDNEEGYKDESPELEVADAAIKESGWHSDNELNSKSFRPRLAQPSGYATHLYSEKTQTAETKSNLSEAASFSAMAHSIDDPYGVPPEWTPPNVTVPMLNLVDKVFQLKRRGWIRRHVFWISKQILQLVMEDAVDDWLLGQINWLRREDVVAQGIRWVKDILWPDGKFFLKLEITGGGLEENDLRSFQATPRASKRRLSQSELFETQLEAARRASFVKEMLFNGAPAPLVSLVGQKQYKRCARDIYFFLQSSVCLKQLTFAVLELLLVSVFPELKGIVLDIHKKKQTQFT